jgi:hypothetical protein
MVRPDNSHVPKKVMGGCFRGRRPVRSPRGRWEDAVDLLQIQNWKAAARNGECWRRKIEAIEEEKMIQ